MDERYMSEHGVCEVLGGDEEGRMKAWFRELRQQISVVNARVPTHSLCGFE